MKKYWLMAVVVAALLLAQTVLLCGGALAEEHEHVLGSWEYDIQEHWRKCTADGCSYMEAGFHEWGDVEVLEPANEEKEGLGRRTCEVCGYVDNLYIIPITGHTHEYGEWNYNSDEHWRKCTKEGCSWSTGWGEHEWIQNGGGYECTVCHATKDHETCKWSTEWTAGNDGHWHGCTYEGCDRYTDYALHNWVKDENGIKCSVCGKANTHIDHVWSEEWSSGAFEHWHGCTYEGCTAKNDRRIHTWEKVGGELKCTVCGAIRNHENHTWSDKWSSSNERHWHGCTYEGCTEKLGEAKHNFVNGVCECGYKQQINNPVSDEEVTPVAPAPLPPQTGDASWLAAGIGMIAAAVCIALRKKQSN